jgi:hypothetical protein
MIGIGNKSSKLRRFVQVVAMAVVGGTMLLPATALADTWTSYFVIDYLDNDGNTARDAFAVASDVGSFTTNPAGCAKTTYAVANPNASAASKEIMNKVLLAAFLAGRKVRLYMSSSICSSGNVTYSAVAVDNDQ